MNIESLWTWLCCSIKSILFCNSELILAKWEYFFSALFNKVFKLSFVSRNSNISFDEEGVYSSFFISSFCWFSFLIKLSLYKRNITIIDHIEDVQSSSPLSVIELFVQIVVIELVIDIYLDWYSLVLFLEYFYLLFLMLINYIQIIL